MFSILVSKTATHKANLDNICLHTCQAHLHPALQEKTSVASLQEYMACLRRVLLPHRKAENSKKDELHEAEAKL